MIFKIKQSTVESSVSGSEFEAMKWGIDALPGLRYELRMMVTPISGSLNICGDNMTVVHNAVRPGLVLQKKST